jgi:uncharacterized protein YbjT (DUF2867 family)
MKALLFGASGFVGSYLLQELLNDPSYEQVIVVSRKDPGVEHPKLKVLIGDFQKLPSLKNELIADDVFITLGTTKKKTPDQKEYYQIDHDYPVLAAKFAKENGARAVFLLTAVGANEKSNIFYVRTKGEVERDIIALNFAHTHIFRPSMIMGDRIEKRPVEKIFLGIWAAINPLLLGSMSKYKGIHAKEIAKAMINAAKDQREKLKFHHYNEMKSLI